MPGKRYRKIAEKTKKDAVYSIADAVSFLKENTFCKFDETVEIAINLTVDPRNTDQNIRGMVTMPAGTGKTMRTAVFAKGDQAAEATAAGADFVGAEDLVDKITSGSIEFDVCIASPDMMGLVGRLGKILGPRGLMPNPKLGTVTPNVAAAVTLAKSGQVEYRLDKGGIVHAGLCKLSFSSSDIEENIKAFVVAVMQARPSGVKGTYLKSAAVSSTMSVGIPLDNSELLFL
jgi:large subunit ribosomal protein L1